MMIRRAIQSDIPGINRLLRQVLMVHHSGRPDLFKANAKKYTDEQLAEYVGAIIANQSADVDIVSGATVDCQAIGTAIGQAFAK